MAVSDLETGTPERRKRLRGRRRSDNLQPTGADQEPAAHIPRDDTAGPVIACQEQERTRIAADLHDSIGSALALAKLKLEQAIRQVPADASQVKTAEETLASIAAEMDRTIDEVRRIAMNLRPSMLDDLGIVATMSWFARELKACGSDVQVLQEIGVREEDVPGSLKTAIFRIVQEASNNAIKHSQADLVRIVLRREIDVLQLIVEDNGVGFEVPRVVMARRSGHSFGLASMHERVRGSGGTLVIDSAPGHGTRVFASWPVEGREEV